MIPMVLPIQLAGWVGYFSEQFNASTSGCLSRCSSKPADLCFLAYLIRSVERTAWYFLGMRSFNLVESWLPESTKLHFLPGDEIKASVLEAAEYKDFVLRG